LYAVVSVSASLKIEVNTFSGCWDFNKDENSRRINRENILFAIGMLMIW
jgi:hypothetical protein